MSEPASSPPPAADRRPIAARRFGVFQRMASGLARRGVTPNAISVLGMLAGILAGGAFAATSCLPDLARALWLVGAAGIGLRLLANMLDGMVAVEGGLGTPVGALFNEAPDRVSDAVVLVGCGYAAGGLPWLGFTAALAAVLVAYVRALAASTGAPNDFCGPMAKQQRMALVILCALWMALAPASLAISPGPATWVLALIVLGCVVTAIRRLIRAARALRGEVV